MFWTAFRKYNSYGIELGPAGLANFIGPAGAFTFPTVPWPSVWTNTVVWVVVVVLVTLVLSLGTGAVPQQGRSPGASSCG